MQNAKARFKAMHISQRKYFPSDLNYSALKNSIPRSDLINDPDLLKIFCDPKIIRPIQQYLGIFPSIQFIAAWQSQGLERPIRNKEMYWHMDHHGHRFVKVFFYLDTVKKGIGHHQFIAGTHNQALFDKKLEEMKNSSSHLREVIAVKRKLRSGYKIYDDAIWPLAEDIVDVIGNEGTGFAEDTRGLHRGTPLPPKTNRKIIQCLYVPFSNGKDERLSLKIGKEIFKSMQYSSGYNDLETAKLFSLIDY